MKRIFALVLALCLCFGLCACGKSTSANAGSAENSNGYPTMEAAVDANVKIMCVAPVSRDEFRRTRPESVWAYEGEEYFDECYENYKLMTENNINTLKDQFGDDYRISWEIVEVEDLITKYGYEFSEEELRKFRDIFGEGIGIEEYSQYAVTISSTIIGSKDEDTSPLAFRLSQIAGRWYLF